MAIGTGIIFCTLVLGSLALKPSEIGLAAFFDHDEGDMPIYDDNDFAVQGRIVGGRVAPNGGHPWIVAFTTGGNARHAHCGGSIITRRTILTAAHCVWPVRQGNNVQNHVRVNAGTNRFASGGQSLSINGQAIHPSYRHVTPPRNDIAVMYTASNINLGGNVRVIAISWDNIGGGMNTRVAGWGGTRQDGQGPAAPQLLEIDVPTITSQRCNDECRRRGTSSDGRIEICTFHSVGVGTCRGDSGSPLVRRDRTQQIGVVAWGFPCARGGPDMYARVSAFRSWIQQNTRN